MLAFPFFAVMIWFLAAHFRRRWQSFFAVAVGTALLCLIEFLLWRAQFKYERWIVPQQVIWLLIPFTVLVLAIGLFIACLPKAPPTDHHCPKCFYDLAGLDPLNLSCPECGRRWTGRGSDSTEERHRLAELGAIREHEAETASLAEAARQRREAARAQAGPG